MKNIAVNFGRQLGAGGLTIAKTVAEKLGYKFYDKEILKLIALKSGYSLEFLDSYDEKPKDIMPNIYNVFFDAGIYYNEANHYDVKLTEMFTNTIIKLSEEADSVFVGRCADYILKDKAECINIFIYAPLEHRKKMIKERDTALTDSDVEKMIKIADKKRRLYYETHTNKVWGEHNSYHLMVDSSLRGAQKTADAIYEYLCQAL